MTLFVTHGARKNAGDYLIRERGLALIQDVLGAVPIASIPRWEPLPRIAPDDVLLLVGGPGVQAQLAANVYPCLVNALEVGAPIGALAIGWSGDTEVSEARLDAETTEILSRMPMSGMPLGVRDVLTQEILTSHGIDGVQLTGCTAWYDKDHLGRAIQSPEEVRTLVVTPPAHARNATECVRLMGALARRYPSAERFAVFHRGLWPDRETRLSRSAIQVAMAAGAARHRFRIIDAAYGTERLSLYSRADLHVGYRVHAHLAFVSQHRPSLLICEDGRGLGQIATLEDEPPLRAGSTGLLDQVGVRIENESRDGWQTLHHSVGVIEATYPTMRSSLDLVGTVVGA